MKLIFSTLICLMTVFLESHGQTTPPSDMIVPRTACGKRAFQCWADREAAMHQADEEYYFTLACQLYKEYTDCYNSVSKDATCAKEPEVLSIGQEAVQDQGGICYDDGTVKQCGLDLQSCLNDVLLIQDAFKKKNATAACPVINKFMSCAEATRNRFECPSNLMDLLDKLETSLNQDDMISGCGGTCGLLIGQCTGNLTDILVNKEILFRDWKQFCSVAYSAIFCLNGLGSNANCTGNSIVESVGDSNQLVIRDYCAGNAKPSPCMQRLEACTEAWRNVGTSGTIDQQCQASSTLLECTTHLSCSQDVDEILMSLRSEIDSGETKKHCPTVGSCSDRIAVCGSWQQDLEKVKNAKTATSEFCTLVRTGSYCYYYVRSDSVCVKENITVSDFEKQITLNLTSLCGGVCGQTSISVFLFAAALLATILRSL